MHRARSFATQMRQRFDQVVEHLGPLETNLPEADRLIFMVRLERYFEELCDGLAAVYGQHPDFQAFLSELSATLLRSFAERPADLKRLDLVRDLTPDWFQRETMTGYVFYVERFASSLSGVAEHIDYLEELGVNYLHLMSVLQPRGGENDGGYAVVDYRSVDPRLGTIEDLEELCRRLRERGISVCIDLVLNHCADDHPWAVSARDGDQHHQGYFHLFANRSGPDRYEKTLPEVFPDFAPGNFSYQPEMRRWVWTTFHEYQWDLNWTNPKVFLEIAEILLFLANRGVEVFRLDAVAFMWKRMGTNCQNQPEVHALLQALRACSRIAAAAVAHKAEAIVSPDDLMPYLGTGARYGKVSNIAYHNTLMVQFWSALASRDSRLMTHTLHDLPRSPGNVAWVTYLRCHDDIGWAVTEEDAAAVDLDGFLHRDFLAEFYSGRFPGSFARGAVFQHNPITRDRRISGSLASLAGLEAALAVDDDRLVGLAIARILLGHALISGFGGIPLLYMGDELGLLNDYGFAREAAHAEDNRWLHRPRMDWDRASGRHQAGSVEARIFTGIGRILRARRSTPALHAGFPPEILDIGHPRLFAHLKPHPVGDVIAVYNVTEEIQRVDAARLWKRAGDLPMDRIEGRPVPTTDGTLELRPYQALWLQ